MSLSQRWPHTHTDPRLHQCGTQPRRYFQTGKGLGSAGTVNTLPTLNDLSDALEMPIQAGMTYVFDKGYCDYNWWHQLQTKGAFFVTRLKKNANIKVLHKHSISGLVKAEMFPPQVRALGVGLAYAVANAIFGGSAEYVALGLKSMGMENSFYWYVTVMMAIAFLFSFRLPKQPKYLHHDL